MDEKTYNQISGMENAIDAVKKIVNEKTVEEKFKKLIKIANSNFDKDLEQYDEELQNILIDFTRIFNLSQLVYILKTYKILQVEYYDDMVEKLEKILNKRMEKSKYSVINSYLDYIDVSGLLDDEIDGVFDDEENQDLQYRVYKIGLIAYQIEKSFQLKDWSAKIQKLNGNIIANSIFGYRTEGFKTRIKEEKEKWDAFEKEYINYLNTLKSEFADKEESENKEKEEKNPYYEIMKEQKPRPITFVDEVIKNTITFKQYIDANANKDFAKDFLLLFNDYASQFHLDTVNTTLLSGHIYYFRLLTITKAILLMQEFGIENMYYDNDMIQIIGEPLANTDQNDISALLCMEQETAYNLIHNDIELIIPQDSNLDDRQMYQYLFCVYLNVENSWRQFIYEKDMGKVKHKYEEAIVKPIHTNTEIIKNFFEEYMQKVNFNVMKNQTIGKIIDFPF